MIFPLHVKIAKILNKASNLFLLLCIQNIKSYIYIIECHAGYLLESLLSYRVRKT